MSIKAVMMLLAVFALLEPGPLLAQAWTGRSSPANTHQRRFPATPPVMLSGQVVMADGSPLQHQIQIELVCNGRVQQQTLTAPDGSFFLEVGSPRTEDWMDPVMGGSGDGTVEASTKVASPSGPAKADEVPSMGQGRAALTGCEVRALPVPGYTSNRISLQTRSSSENPDIGRIIIRRMSDAEATTVSLKTLSAPEGARKAFDKANEALQKEKPDTGKAVKELQKAIKEYPEFSEAWDLLGRAQMMEGNAEKARESFQHAIEAEPKFLQPYMGLAQMAVQKSDWKETSNWSEKVIALDKGFAPALYWNGLAGYYLGDFEQGVQSLSRLYDLGYRSEYPFGLLPLGVMYANLGRIKPAAEHLRLYLKAMPPEQVPAAQRTQLEQQLAQWESAGLVKEPLGAAEETKQP